MYFSNLSQEIQTSDPTSWGKWREEKEKKKKLAGRTSETQLQSLLSYREKHETGELDAASSLNA